MHAVSLSAELTCSSIRFLELEPLSLFFAARARLFCQSSDAYNLLLHSQPTSRLTPRLVDSLHISVQSVCSTTRHERSEQRLGANEVPGGEAAEIGMAARRTYASAQGRPSATAAWTEAAAPSRCCTWTPMKFARLAQPVEWALVVVDPFSEWKRFTRLQSKAQCPQAMIDIIQLVERQTGLRVKRLHTDGGTEFKGELTRFCRNRGIELHFPPARTPQLNGIAERHVRTSKEGARTLLLHSTLPESFWHYAAAHHAHLWNQDPHCRAHAVHPLRDDLRQAAQREAYGGVRL